MSQFSGGCGGDIFTAFDVFTYEKYVFIINLLPFHWNGKKR